MTKTARIIQTLLIPAAAMLLLVLLPACEDNKSYSDLLRDEEVAVNWYLAQQRVVASAPADSVFETGPEAPFYRMNNEGSVYMRVINPGNPDNRPRKGDRVYFRFMRSNIKYLKQGAAGAGEGNADDMASSLGSLSLVYGNTVLESTTRFGTGIQLPLNWLGYDCEVELVVKSIEGFAGDISQCNPYLYKGLKYYKAEY